MNQRSSNQPPSPLHPRLTVAHARPDDRPLLAETLLALPYGSVIDLETGAAQVEATTLVTSAVLAGAAAEIATARLAERGTDVAAIEQQLVDALAARDVSAARHDVLAGRCTQLRDGAGWCDEAVERLGAAGQTAIDAARAQADVRRADLRAAQARLDRVLEQRAAAAAAVDAAQSELNDLDGAGLDELDLRRELEAVGQALGEADAAHAHAVSELAALDRAHAETTASLASLAAGRAVLEEKRSTGGDSSALVRAFMDYEAFASIAPLDATAAALAHEIASLEARLTEVSRHSPAPPSAGEMDAAQRAVDEATARLATAIEQVETITPAERAALDEAHDATHAAEERSNGRSSRRERELDEARARERALLDRHGFASYLDVVLTGGRTPHDQRQRLDAERDYADATRTLEALRERAKQGGRAELEAQRTLLLNEAAQLLCVDPGDNAVALLAKHAMVPVDALMALRWALDAAGVDTTGRSLAAAARDCLDVDGERATEAARAGERLKEISAEETQRKTDLVRIESQLAEARAALDAAYAERDLAQQAVKAIEAEMTARVGGDPRRVERISAAQRLRAQVESVERTLVGAEQDARAELDAAADAASDAEVACDRAETAVADVQRRMSELNAAVPADLQPVLGPGVVDGAADLAAALRETAMLVERDLEIAADDVARATTVAGDIATELRVARDEARGEPTADDIAAAMWSLITTGPGISVLDDPISSMGPDRDSLLEVLVAASAHRPVTILTDDPAVLGWAIELPGDVAAVVSAKALADRLPKPERKATTCASASEPS